jgi:acetoin utilization deacetylase AcuC-like enzyme
MFQADSTMAGMPLAVVSSDEFANHLTPPGHPERPERAHVFDAVAAAWTRGGGTVLAPRPATLEELAAVHDRDHVERIAGTAGRAAMLDPDTFTSPESYRLARLAAGATLVGVDYTMAGSGPALVLVRPPGHHAERGRAMGFCLFNNVAVAAAYVRAKGVLRVAVVDVDVHHGNGTQEIFQDDPAVLYISTHQSPCYPGTGAVEEVGISAGRGRTVNIPIEPGAGDDDYAQVLDRVVVPILKAFAADVTILSVGYDAHVQDPLAQMQVTTEGYRSMLATLKATADATSGGRLVVVTEGGYDLPALGACLDATVEVLAAPVVAAGAAGPAGGPAAAATRTSGPGIRGREAAAAALAVQKPFWAI